MVTFVISRACCLKIGQRVRTITLSAQDVSKIITVFGTVRNVDSANIGKMLVIFNRL